MVEQTGLDLIIDKKVGRKFAQYKNIQVTGLLGILKINLLNNFINYTEPLFILEEFKNVDFRLSKKLEIVL